jgi:hypothetical protein
MAREVGVSRHMISRALAAGRLVRVAGRAYAPAGRPDTPSLRARAAALTWPDGVVCLRTAALLHGFPLRDDGRCDVLVPDTRRSAYRMTSRQWSVRPVEVDLGDGFALTNRLTTLADCLGRLADDEAWGLLAWMWTREMIHAEDIEAQLDDRFHLYGVVRLRRMLRAVRRGALSMGEVRLHEFLEEFGFTGWRGDQPIRDDGGKIVARVDVLFSAHRLVIEFDGAIAHHSGTADRDRLRDERLRRLGYRVVRVTWATLHERRRCLRDELRAALLEQVA